MVVLHCPHLVVGVLGVILFHSFFVVFNSLFTISTEPSGTGQFDRCQGKCWHVGLEAGLWVGQANGVFYHLRVEFAVSNPRLLGTQLPPAMYTM